MRRPFPLLLALMPLLTSLSFNRLASPTPPCMPSGLAATPLPASRRLGGLEATFASLASDPGETCALRYAAPDDVVLQGEGTGAITADENGVWRWAIRRVWRPLDVAQGWAALPGFSVIIIFKGLNIIS